MLRVVVASLVLFAPLRATGIPGPPQPSVIITRFDDPSPPPESCITAAPDCSLRGALTVAETTSGVSKTVTIPPGVYQLEHGAVALDGHLDLVGGGADDTSIDALTNDRAFAVTPSSTVSITGLTILHGKGTGDGGAIANQGTLTPTDCVLRNNSSNGNGGAVSSTGTLELVRTVIVDNAAAKAGGGVVNDRGSFTAVDSRRYRRRRRTCSCRCGRRAAPTSCAPESRRPI